MFLICIEMSQLEQEEAMARVVGGRRHRRMVGGRGTDQFNMGQRDPAVHIVKGELAQHRAMEGFGTPAQRHRRNQKATHAHMMGGAVGFVEDMGMPQMAGGRSSQRRIHHFRQQSQQSRMNEHLGAEIEHLRRGGGMSGGGVMDYVRPLARVAKYVAPFVAPVAGSVVSGALGALGFGRMSGGNRWSLEEKKAFSDVYEEMGHPSAYPTQAHYWVEFADRINDLGVDRDREHCRSHFQKNEELYEAGKALNAMKNSADGYGRRTRRPAGATDARRARATIVRQVMRDRGLSLPEASRLVKAEGLYNASQHGRGMSGGAVRPHPLQPNAPLQPPSHAPPMRRQDGRRMRAEIVARVMRERNVSLPQASKMVKEEGLY